MDPQTAWNELLSAWHALEWQSVHDSAQALLAWLDGNGFPPETVPGHRMGNEWNRIVVRAACEYAADVAVRVQYAPDGIPEGVPFSVSCCDCDVDGPATYQQAVAEGWTNIAFYPQGLSENFLGQCPQHSQREA